MKKSDEALTLAERIANGNDVVYPPAFLNNFIGFLGRAKDWEFSIEHQILALCWYATLLKDEGK